jgi:hypothetical protein
MQQILENYYAEGSFHEGIEGFRKIIKEIPFLSPRERLDMLHTKTVEGTTLR